jgi:hypothetical protein
MKRRFYRIVITVASAALAVVVLYAISKHCARRSADRFVGVEITTQLPYFWSYMNLYGLGTSREVVPWPRWVVRYGGAFVDPGIEVEVTLWGEVSRCNVPELQQLIGVPEPDRLRRVHDFVEERTPVAKP